MSKKRICLNCKYFTYDVNGVFFCILTGFTTYTTLDCVCYESCDKEGEQ